MSKWTAAIVICIWSAAASMAAAATTYPPITFESLGGTLADREFSVIGTSSVLVDNVKFQVPSGQPIYIFGPNTGPLATKSIGLWTFDPEGLTITFPNPVNQFSFDAGQDSVETGAMLEVNSTGLGWFYITLSRTELGHFNYHPLLPTTSVHFRFVSGSTSLMQLDNLSYTAVPEPGVVSALAIGLALARRRR